MIFKNSLIAISLLSLLSVPAVSMAGPGCAHGEAAAEAAADTGAAATAKSTAKTYALTVEGMSCAVSCAPKVQESLAAIEGVRSVNVDFETKKATVAMNDGHELTTEAANKSFGNGGYFVSGIEESSGS